MTHLSLVHSVRPASQGEGPFPALVLLHGLGSNEADLMGFAPSLDPRLVVLAPRAPRALVRGGYSWYDLEGSGPGLGSESIEESLSLLDRFLHEIVEAYEIDPRAICLGGFSMGAAMAGATALLHPDCVSGALMLSGYLPPDTEHRYRLQEAAGLPVFQAHGTQDGVVPLEYAHLTRDFFRQSPVALTYREYPMGHFVTQDELDDLSAWLDLLLDARTPAPHL